METKKVYAVAVDGPSGAGKSTLAKAIAKEMNIIYVDTGAMYRCIGLYMYRSGIGSKDVPKVIEALPQVHIEMRYEDGLQHMILNGQDVTEEIRLPEMSMYASDVSAISEVRTFLLEAQRAFARENSVIMDGRDIGTVVLPDAQVKIFLYADVEVRARRRFLELEQRGTCVPYEEVLKDMEQRDYNDTHREIAPLQPAADSIMIDTSRLSFRESLELLLDVVRGSIGE